MIGMLMLINDNSINVINAGLEALSSLFVKTMQSDNCNVDFEVVIVPIYYNPIYSRLNIPSPQKSF